MTTTALQLIAGAPAVGASRVIVPVMAGLVYAGLFDSGNIAFSRLNRAPGGGRCSSPFDTLPTIDGPYTVFKGCAAAFDTGVPDMMAVSMYVVGKTAATETGLDRPMFVSAFGADNQGLFFTTGPDTGSISSLAVTANATGSPSQPAAIVGAPINSFKSPKLMAALAGNGVMLVADITDNISGTAVPYTGLLAPSGRNLLIGSGYPYASQLTGEAHMLLALIYNRLLSADEQNLVVLWCKAYAAAAGVIV